MTVRVEDLAKAVDERNKQDEIRAQQVRERVKFQAEVAQRRAMNKTMSAEHKADREVMQKSASREDMAGVSDTLNQLVLTTFVQNKDKWEGIIDSLVSLTERLQTQLDRAGKEIPDAQSKASQGLVQGLQTIVDKIQHIKVETETDTKQALQKITEAIQGIEFNPQITVPQPKVTVKPADVSIDLTPVVSVIKGLQKDIKILQDKEQPEVDMTPVQMEVTAVKEAIEGIRFPIPNFIQDPFIQYKPADIDDASTPKYYGFIDPNGHWYIMKEESSTYRYASGTGNGDESNQYPAKWTDRASHNYTYLSSIQL